jgi:hypothetical protein
LSTAENDVLDFIPSDIKWRDYPNAEKDDEEVL